MSGARISVATASDPGLTAPARAADASPSRHDSRATRNSRPTLALGASVPLLAGGYIGMGATTRPVGRVQIRHPLPQQLLVYDAMHSLKGCGTGATSAATAHDWQEPRLQTRAVRRRGVAAPSVLAHREEASGSGWRNTASWPLTSPALCRVVTFSALGTVNMAINPASSVDEASSAGRCTGGWSRCWARLPGGPGSSERRHSPPFGSGLSRQSVLIWCHRQVPASEFRRCRRAGATCSEARCFAPAWRRRS
jgi:hypothetical protein